MKKVYFLIILCFLAAHGMAQDIIITNESKRIEAKVIEITDWQVMYQLRGAADSATYMMGLSMVASIVFENGDVYVPTLNASSEPPKVSTSPMSEEIDFEEEDGNETVISFSSGRSVVLRSGIQLENTGGKIYYGDTQLKGNDIRDLIKQTCPEAYREYKKGGRWCIYGLVPMGASVFFLTKALVNEFNKDKSETAGAISAPSKELWIGIGCLALSIPIIIKGGSHLQKVYKVYNQSCAASPQKKNAILSFNISPAAVGLSLSF